MSENLIREGIAGFWMADEEPPAVMDISRKQILTDCYLVARNLKLTVGTTDWAEIARNFHAIEFAGRAESLWVLFNLNYPLCAFSRLSDGNLWEIEFIDHPALSEQFRNETRFQPVSAECLHRTVTREDLKSLNRAERKQAAYWRPSTVGEIVFNCWD